MDFMVYVVDVFVFQSAVKKALDAVVAREMRWASALFPRT